MRRARAALLVALALLAAGCSPAASSAPGSSSTPAAQDSGSPAQPTPTAGAPDTPTASTGSAREANVITGQVTTMDGTPIPGAQLRIVGYTGGATLGQEIETVESGADGHYRYEATPGLYEVLGEAIVDFDGQSYTFVLEPVDGECGQEMSDAGIVEDFVLSLTGLVTCVTATDPENYTMYHGAAIQLFDGLTGTYSPDAVVEYTLVPTSALADGTEGETLTFERTLTALETSSGPIEDTWILHDIPLATYRASATLLEGGASQPLLVSTGAGEAASEVDIEFGARSVLAGYTVPDLTVYDTAQ